MHEETLSAEKARGVSERFIESIPPYPGNFRGRGIIICGGGLKYFPGVWICIKMLRWLGCTLPIQIWYLGHSEIDGKMQCLVRPLNVTCVDALDVRGKHPARILNGWELKPYSILHCHFREVLFLDADNVPIVNPEYLFETPQFKQNGAIFWPDMGRLAPSHPIWEVCGIPYRDEPEIESGQIVVDKERCWKPLCLTMWYNEYSDFYYRHVHGDKETFHLAFRKLNHEYAMPSTPIHGLEATFCQHDFAGARIFQHRNYDKWEYSGVNKTIQGFLYEAECREFLESLRQAWDGKIGTTGMVGDDREKMQHWHAEDSVITVDLSKIKIFVFTLAEHRERQSRISKMMDLLQLTGFEFVYGTKSDPHWMGMRSDYRRLLDTPCPFLLLEDDATVVYENYSSVVEYPEGTDVVYLGGTRNADSAVAEEIRSRFSKSELKEGRRGNVDAALLYLEYDKTYLRPLNMHGTHAVLFLEERAKHAFRKSIDDHPDTPVDVCFAREMHKWNVLLRRDPVWYQCDSRNDHVTRLYP